MQFFIPSHWSVLVVDDEENRARWFRARLPKCMVATSAKRAAFLLSRFKFNVVFLDHDLHWLHAANSALGSSGQGVAMLLKRMNFQGIVVVHSHNEEGAAAIKKILPNSHRARFDSFEVTYGSRDEGTVDQQVRTSRIRLLRTRPGC